MNELTKKIISRLEDLKKRNSEIIDKDSQNRSKAYQNAINIVYQTAEEYNGYSLCMSREFCDYQFFRDDDWNPVQERLPEDCTIFEVTAQNGNGMRYTEFAYYDTSKGEWWKHDDSGLVNVLAWKEHSSLYQSKQE